MSKLKATTTVSTEVGLSTRVKAQLRVQMTEYATIQAQIAALEAKKDKIKERVQEMFVDNGEVDALMNGTEIDGFKVKMVCGQTSRLDKKKLVTLGCKMEWLEKATKKTDNKPYVKITPPGESSHEEES